MDPLNTFFIPYIFKFIKFGGMKMKIILLQILLLCCSTVYGYSGFEISQTCAECLKDTKTITDDIKKVAIDVGPVTTCAGLCDLVKKLTNSSVTGDVCDVLCSLIGIKEFKKYVNNTELNYGEYCEFKGKCLKEKGEGTLVSASVQTPITLGENIVIVAILTVSKEYGLTQFLFECPKNKTSPDLNYWGPFQMGTWKAEWSIGTDKDWKVGNYTCDLKVCDTICNSFPKEKDMGSKELTFEIKKPAELRV